MTNYRLYHASKEDLIGGMKTPWIRSGRQGVKDHKRNHDSDDDDEDDDDDEGPSAGSNQDTNIRCTLPREVSTTTWFKPIPESERPATPEPEWTIPPKRLPKTEHNLANTYATRLKFRRKTSFKGRRMILVRSSNCSANEQERRSTAKQFRRTTELSTLVKAFHKNILQYQMDECHKLLTNKVDLSNPEGDKERKIALSISKLKVARYLDFGLEELVPSLWVESEREYDISAVYGITHWWFSRKEFYINKHNESSDREAVRSQMRILNVISVKVFEKYGYNYLREIILCRADYQEYKISE
ncbi:hypothetical protein Tco_1147140 [Tanacetum coccineum]